jgi:hypothetical protein
MNTHPHPLLPPDPPLLPSPPKGERKLEPPLSTGGEGSGVRIEREGRSTALRAMRIEGRKMKWVRSH